MFRTFKAAFVVTALLLVSATCVSAEDNSAINAGQLTTPAAVMSAPLPNELTAAAPGNASWVRERPVSTPALKTLFGSYAVLQGLDLYSTVTARRAGAREVNPLMDGNMGQMLAVKALTGAVTYAAIHRMAKKNRRAAIVTMAILNGVTGAVVAHNMKNARQ